MGLLLILGMLGSLITMKGGQIISGLLRPIAMTIIEIGGRVGMMKDGGSLHRWLREDTIGFRDRLDILQIKGIIILEPLDPTGEVRIPLKGMITVIGNGERTQVVQY